MTQRMKTLFAFIACNCHRSRSVNSSCDIVTGQCYCESGFSGSDCSLCPDGYHEINYVCTGNNIIVGHIHKIESVILIYCFDIC